MKNNLIFLLILFFASCKHLNTENQLNSSKVTQADKKILQNSYNEKTYTIKNNIEFKIDTLKNIEENIYFKKITRTENLILANKEIGNKIQKIMDSIYVNYLDNFNNSIAIYKEDEELLSKLKERPAELDYDASFSIITDSIISFSIEIYENFPLGTIYPHYKQIPINYSLSTNKILTNKDLVTMNDSLKFLIKERLLDPSSDSPKEELETLNAIVEKEDYNILLTEKELIILYFEYSLKEQSASSFSYDEIFDNLKPILKNNLQEDLKE